MLAAVAFATLTGLVAAVPFPPNFGTAKLFINGDTTKCIRVSVVSEGAPVQLGDCSITSGGQDWSLNRGGTKLRAKDNMDLCIDAMEVGDNKKLQLQKCVEGKATQRWYYTDDNHIALEGQNPGQCIDNTDGITWEANQLQTYTCIGDSTNQIWTSWLGATSYPPLGGDQAQPAPGANTEGEKAAYEAEQAKNNEGGDDAQQGKGGEGEQQQ